MKWERGQQSAGLLVSLPVRGAWIEIRKLWRVYKRETSLPVRGAWIEMARAAGPSSGGLSRSPCGERGLKLLAIVNCTVSVLVAPRAGSVD